MYTRTQHFRLSSSATELFGARRFKNRSRRPNERLPRIRRAPRSTVLNSRFRGRTRPTDRRGTYGVRVFCAEDPRPPRKNNNDFVFADVRVEGETRRKTRVFRGTNEKLTSSAGEHALARGREKTDENRWKETREGAKTVRDGQFFSR